MSLESEANAKPICYAFLDFRLDVAQGLLFHGSEEISLRPKSYEIFRCLVKSSGRLVTRAELMQEVWGDVAVTDESITKCIADVRKALGDDSQEIVRTVKGRGFLFQPEVQKTYSTPQMPAQRPAGARRWFWAIALLVLMIAAGSVYWLFARRGAVNRIQSVVVLPFVNMSGDPNEEYFSDGITEETTDALARTSGLRVVARTSAFQFKGKAQDIRKIGQQVGADAVLEGSVRRAGDKLRVTAQLDSVRDGYYLWSRTWEREAKDVFALEREIAQGVAQTVQRSAKGLPAGRSEPHSVEAYNLYLRGGYAWREGDPDHLTRAIQFLEKCVAIDPEFAPAYARLAVAYFFSVSGMQKRSTEAYPKVREYAHKALMLDDSLPEAWVASNLPNLMYNDHQPVMLASGEKSLLRAIELDPSLAEAHAAYADYLSLEGRAEESFHEYDVAMRLDPLLLDLAASASVNYVDHHEWERAIRTAKAALDVNPHFFPALISLEYTYESSGRVEDALVLQEQNNMHSPAMLAAKRAAFNRDGARGYWQATVETWAPGGEPKYPFSTILVAVAYGHLRDTESCLKWIERGYAEGLPNVVFLKRTPAFVFLHGNPRFEAIASKIGVP